MENQNIEYKETWRDEYIKWICGFANAFGGKIYIGIDDKGNISGINDAKKLLEEIPNKTKDLLGILVDVNLKTKSKKYYLEIVVESYPYPVIYKGQYHFRSGSTKQELKGAALDKFILQKQGKHWDTVPQPNLKMRLTILKKNQPIVNEFLVNY
jgi:ATP-dependent DNA helicase RecG